MPTIKNLIFSLKALIFLFIFAFLPLQAHEQYTSACECESYLAPEQEAPFIVPPPLLKPPTQEVVRAAIDIGSGATKLRVALVNLKTHKIDKILVNESFPVQYQEQLSKSANGAFDAQVMQTGLEAIKKSEQIAEKYHPQKIIAVATASFRKAANSQSFIDKIYQETGVRVYVIDQELEGKLAFNAVLAQGHYNPYNLIVWDIGGGSLQLTALDPQGRFNIYRGEVASIQFKNSVIQDIQHKDPNQVTTPNPLSPNEIQQAVVKAREVAQSVDSLFKDRIHQPDTQVVGVGNIFAYTIYPVVGKKSPYTQQDLYRATMNMANQDDQQLGGGDYANVQATNAILVLGYMQALNIHQMQALDINNADGALLYSEFWNS